MSTTFRKELRKLSPNELELVHGIKSAAEDLYERIDMANPSRERDIAKQKLEECVMWAVKAVANSVHSHLGPS